MGFPINLYTIESEYSIVNIEESQVIISKKYIVFLSPKIDLVLQTAQTLMKWPSNAYDAAFHRGLHCLPKYLLIRGFPVKMGEISTRLKKM